MSTHCIKIWPEYFDAVLSGDKKHEIRINDRDYRVGDTLIMREYDPSNRTYSGRRVRVNITYITVNRKQTVSRMETNYLRQKVAVMSIEVMEEKL